MANAFTLQPATATWVVRAGGAVLAQTDNALELHEGDYPPVIYFPRADISMELFDKSDNETICPHKGTASYFSIAARSGPTTNVAWSYENPIAGAEDIADHLAFYSDRVAVAKV